MSSNTLFIGIDLGTFKTSVACSNGNRHVFPTAVGWPKDAVAKKMFGKSVVFGDQLRSHSRALRIVRPFAKGALKYVDHQEAGVADRLVATHLTAAKLVVDHAVEQVCSGSPARVFGAIGAPSQASVHNHKIILDAAQGAFEAAVVVHEPFAVGYGTGKLDQTLIVDIGAGTIDICPMFGSYPNSADQLTIPLGGDLIDEAILAAIHQTHPEASCSLDIARQLKEKYGSVHEQKVSAHAKLNVNGTARSFDIASVLHTACDQLVAPIVQGIWQVVSKLEPEYHRPLLENVVLAGGGSQLAGLDRRVETGLAKFGGGNVTRVYDSVFAGATGALKLAMDTPMDQWNRLSTNAKHAA